MSEDKAGYVVCNKCQDKGYIDTGNNDLPCGCEKGLRTLINSAEHSYPVTGKQLLEERGIKPGLIYSGEDMISFAEFYYRHFDRENIDNDSKFYLSKWRIVRGRG